MPYFQYVEDADGDMDKLAHLGADEPWELFLRQRAGLGSSINFLSMLGSKKMMDDKGQERIFFNPLFSS